MPRPQNLPILPHAPYNLHAHRQPHTPLHLHLPHRYRHGRMPRSVKLHRVTRQPHRRTYSLNRRRQFPMFWCYEGSSGCNKYIIGLKDILVGSTELTA